MTIKSFLITLFSAFFVALAARNIIFGAFFLTKFIALIGIMVAIKIFRDHWLDLKAEEQNVQTK